MRGGRPKTTTLDRMLDHIAIQRFKRSGALAGPWRNLLAPMQCPLVAGMRCSHHALGIIWRDRRVPPQVIEVRWRQVGFGWRPFLVCPCGRGASRFYLRDGGFGMPSYRCHRHCLKDVLYGSQCQSASGRKAYRASKLRLRLLRGSARLTDPLPARPRGMSRKRYERIAAVAPDADQRSSRVS
jgi:hypothetical protein